MEGKAPLGEFEFLPPTPEELAEKQKLEKFRNEIMALAEKEAEDKKRKEKDRTGHFLDIKMERGRVTGDALRIAEKIKSGEITMEDMEIYHKKTREEYDANIAAGAFLKPYDKTTENAVAAYLGNKAAVVIGRRQLEEKKRARQSSQ